MGVKLDFMRFKNKLLPTKKSRQIDGFFLHFKLIIISFQHPYHQ